MLVTYGDRFTFLQQAMDALLQEGVGRIVVVSNGAVPRSRAGLEARQQELSGRLQVVDLPENAGSAGGFAAGIRAAREVGGCDFLWLLDDDNRAENGALAGLLAFWDRLEGADKPGSVCVAALRPGRMQYERAVRNSDPDRVLGRRNSFLGFHVLDLRRKLRERRQSPTTSGRALAAGGGTAAAVVPAVPYGGMLFHRRLIDRIGVPDAAFHVYGDDHEFSHRITKLGGRIYLLPSSIVHDLAPSWHQRRGGFMFQRFAREPSRGRLYYAVRNHIVFELRDRVTNRAVYGLNGLAFSGLALAAMLFGLRLRNVHVYLCALGDGLRRRLGRNDRFRL